MHRRASRPFTRIAGQPRRGSALQITVALLVVAAGAGLIYLAYRFATAPEPAPVPAVPAVQVVDDNGQRMVAEFLKESVDPLITDFRRKNDEAATRAIEHLHAEFAKFHQGIEPFADELTGWGTKFGLVGRQSKDLWDHYWHGQSNPDAVRRYVSAIYEKHVCSADTLTRAIQSTLEQYRDDVRANRNEFLTRYREKIEAARIPLPGVELQGLNALVEQVQRDMAEEAKHLAGIALGVEILSLVGSEAATAGTIAVAGMVLRSIAPVITGLVSTELVGASAVATGAATGTVAGAPTGPGIIVTGGIGLAVGIVVDWWLTEQFKAKCQQACGEYLDKVEKKITEGAEDGEGLRTALMQANRAMELSLRRATAKSLGATP